VTVLVVVDVLISVVVAVVVHSLTSSLQRTLITEIMKFLALARPPSSVAEIAMEYSDLVSKSGAAPVYVNWKLASKVNSALSAPAKTNVMFSILVWSSTVEILPTKVGDITFSTNVFWVKVIAVGAVFGLLAMAACRAVMFD